MIPLQKAPVRAITVITQDRHRRREFFSPEVLYANCLEANNNVHEILKPTSAEKEAQWQEPYR